MKDSRTNYSNNSSDFSYEQEVVLYSITGTVAGISFFCCLFVIFLIVIFKKYLFYTQRFILYLDIAAMLTSLARSINLSIKLDGISSEVTDYYCCITGFIDQYASACFLLAIAILTIDIFLRFVFSLPTRKIEALYVIFIFFFPALYCWVPFIYGQYGEAGPWCWIKGDTETGVILQFSLFYGPCFVVYSVLFVLLLVLLFVLYLRRYDYDYEASIDMHTAQNKAELRKDVKKLLVYPALIMLLNIIPFATRIYDACANPLFVLWVFNAIVSPLEGAVIAMAFTFDRETRHRLTFNQIRSACFSFGSRNGGVTEYPAKITAAESVSTTASSSLGDKQPLLQQHRKSSYDSTM